MSKLLAFRFDVLEEEDGTAIVVDSSASKARYQLYRHCCDIGFRSLATGKPWPALLDLRPRRVPEFDELAAVQDHPCHWALKYAQKELLKLTLAKSWKAVTA